MASFSSFELCPVVWVVDGGRWWARGNGASVSDALSENGLIYRDVQKKRKTTPKI